MEEMMQEVMARVFEYSRFHELRKHQQVCRTWRQAAGRRLWRSVHIDLRQTLDFEDLEEPLHSQWIQGETAIRQFTQSMHLVSDWIVDLQLTICGNHTEMLKRLKRLTPRRHLKRVLVVLQQSSTKRQVKSVEKFLSTLKATTVDLDLAVADSETATRLCSAARYPEAVAVRGFGAWKKHKLPGEVRILELQAARLTSKSLRTILAKCAKLTSLTLKNIELDTRHHGALLTCLPASLQTLVLQDVLVTGIPDIPTPFASGISTLTIQRTNIDILSSVTMPHLRSLKVETTLCSSAVASVLTRIVESSLILELGLFDISPQDAACILAYCPTTLNTLVLKLKEPTSRHASNLFFQSLSRLINLHYLVVHQKTFSHTASKRLRIWSKKYCDALRLLLRYNKDRLQIALFTLAQPKYCISTRLPQTIVLGTCDPFIVSTHGGKLLNLQKLKDENMNSLKSIKIVTYEK